MLWAALYILNRLICVNIAVWPVLLLSCLFNLPYICFAAQPRSIGVIAGAVGTGVVLVIICIALISGAFFYWRSKNKEEEEEEIPNEIRLVCQIADLAESVCISLHFGVKVSWPVLPFYGQGNANV